MFGIDLHTHTTASDGTLTPTQLVARAAEDGLAAVAITDHDTVAGLAEGMEAARQLRIELIPGVELAVDYPHGTFHMLGYMFDPQHPSLAQTLSRLQALRETRNERMLERLRELGVMITLQEVHDGASSMQVGRPHIAAALTRKGYAESIEDAFARYLGKSAPAYVPRDKLALQEALELIHGAGGLAVMAHPKTVRLTNDLLLPELRRLRELGLDGIECYYSQYTLSQTDTYLDMAAQVGLFATGGSDFHGELKSNVNLGNITNGRAAPSALLEGLKARKADIA